MNKKLYKWKLSLQPFKIVRPLTSDFFSRYRTRELDAPRPHYKEDYYVRGRVAKHHETRECLDVGVRISAADLRMGKTASIRMSTNSSIGQMLNNFVSGGHHIRRKLIQCHKTGRYVSNKVGDYSTSPLDASYSAIDRLVRTNSMVDYLVIDSVVSKLDHVQYPGNSIVPGIHSYGFPTVLCLCSARAMPRMYNAQYVALRGPHPMVEHHPFIPRAWIGQHIGSLGWESGIVQSLNNSCVRGGYAVGT